MQMVASPAGWIKGYTPQTCGLPSLYQFANRTMADMVDVMIAAGVLDTQEAPRELPPWPPKGISQKRVAALGAELFLDGANSYVVFTYPNEPTTREAKLFDSWAKATTALLCGRSAATDKVPACKFESTAGWFVSPEECRLIAEALDRQLDRQPDRLLASLLASGWTPTKAEKWIRSWASYNRVAADHGGYRVQ